MATLDKTTIEEAARSVLGALRGEKDSGPVSEAATDLREQYERVVATLQSHYGHTRQTAREEIAEFLSDLEAIDPALPEIVADTANEMTGRKGRRGLAAVIAVLVALLGAAAWLWWRSPETYRSLVDAVNRTTRE